MKFIYTDIFLNFPSKALLAFLVLPFLFSHPSFTAYEKNKRKKSDGTAWMGLSYSQAKPKYTVNGTSVNSRTRTPIVNIGGLYQLTDTCAIGASASGVLVGRSEDKANSTGNTMNGTSIGIFASHLFHSKFLIYESLSFSENRAKVERSVPAAGQSSYKGDSLSFAVGGAIFLPITPHNIMNVKLQYSNNQSTTTNYSLGGADVNQTTSSLYPGSKAYVQDMSLAGRITNHSSPSLHPYVEWKGSWVINHSNNLQGVPFHMGNEITLGADIPLSDLFSLAGQFSYKSLVVPGSGFGASLSLKYKIEDSSPTSCKVG